MEPTNCRKLGCEDMLAALRTMSTPSDQYDTPWKEAVERYSPEFMAFYFPEAHAQID